MDRSPTPSPFPFPSLRSVDEPQPRLFGEPDPVEVAWLAGVLEGEGCFGLYGQEGFDRFCVICVSTDLDVVESVHRIAGCGTVISRTPVEGTKQAYQWATWDRDKVYGVLCLVRPYMHSRRAEKLEQMLSRMGAVR